MIGTQTWMSENLNFEIPDSWCYNNDPNNCTKYGRLYSYESSKNVCPEGWHLPSEEEWGTLELFLGLTKEETEIMLHRGDGAGTKLKSNNDWETKINKNDYNITGFNALPGGYRFYYDSTYAALGERGSWWSSTEYEKYSIRYTLFLNKSGIDHDLASKGNGYNVRCLKDYVKTKKY